MSSRISRYMSTRFVAKAGRPRVALSAAAIIMLSHMSLAQSGYVQTNLISDGSVPAAHTDPHLINPWGLSIGKDFWIDSPGSGLSLVTDATGVASFNVAVPPAVNTAAHGSPAGTVFNADARSFVMPQGSATFLFGTLDGTIAGWNASTPAAVTMVNNSASHASYTDIAIDVNSTGTFLLAANFAGGTVDVFDTNFKSTHLSGSFTDPQIPSGFSPFAVHGIGGKVYVDYAQLNPSNGREVVGAGLGYVDVFDLDGNLIQRAISQGVLNAPWGMALAPSTFGKFANDLLVGNFGDGTINAYDPNTFDLKGTVSDGNGAALTNSGLWEIVFGTGSGSTTSLQGDPNTLYIAAGINSGQGGVVAAITPVSAPVTGDFAITASTGNLTVAQGGMGSLSFSLTGSGNFDGSVSLSCSGLPTGDSCVFTPSTITLSDNSTTMVNMSVSTVAAPVQPPTSPYSVGRLNGHTGETLAFASPLALLAFAGMRRKRGILQGTMLAASLFVVSFVLTGCSSSPQQMQAANPPSNASTSQFTVTATSGGLTHSIPVSLTVQ